MKEISIEEKAKAYDIALDKIKRLLGTGGNCSREDLEYVFPELKESEDEMVREVLLNDFKNNCSEYYCQGVNRDMIIAWLEKQGEQKPTLPKWKYKKDNTPLLRDSLILNKYGCVAKSPSGALVSDVWVLDYAELAKLPKEESEKQDEQIPANSAKICKDEQKPIKKHDVCDFCEDRYGCVSPCPTKLIEEEKPADKVDQHSLPVSDDSSLPTFDESIYHPCTEEVCEQKSTAWSEEDESRMDNLCHFLEEYGDQYYGHLTLQGTISWLKSLKPQPRQEWSEEDENEYAHILKTINLVAEEQETKGYNNLISSVNWFKSLKYRVQPQLKQEWSEEDNAMLISIENILIGRGHSFHDKEINWLKSLRPQNKQEWSDKDKIMAFTLMCDVEQMSHISIEGKNKRIGWLKKLPDNISPRSHWKPSEEQIDALNDVISSRDIKYDVLSELWKDLLKLREE